MSTVTPQLPAPTIGRIVIYSSERNDGVVSPAVVLRTRATTNPEVIARWTTKEATLSATDRPADLVAELPDHHTVDLLVHGLGGDYRKYAVPVATEPTPGHWHWPAREPAPGAESMTAGRCDTCGSPADDHPYRHPFKTGRLYPHEVARAMGLPND